VATILAGGGLYYKDSIIGSLENVTFSNPHGRRIVVERHDDHAQHHQHEDCATQHDDDDGTCDATTNALFPKEKDSTLKHSSNNNNNNNNNKNDDQKAECADNHESCDMWASTGECEANPKYMLKQCQKSCMVCGDM
jgi:hypothetical protein